MAGCFLVLGCRLYPRSGAVWRVYAASFAVTVLAALGDVLSGGNYMFLREKPAYGSLLNVLGPWPWYIASTAVLALVLLWLVKLFTDWVRRHDRGAAGHPRTLAFAALGRSGHANTARDMEELREREWDDHARHR